MTTVEGGIQIFIGDIIEFFDDMNGLSIRMGKITRFVYEVSKQ